MSTNNKAFLDVLSCLHLTTIDQHRPYIRSKVSTLGPIFRSIVLAGLMHADMLLTITGWPITIYTHPCYYPLLCASDPFSSRVKVLPLPCTAGLVTNCWLTSL